MSFAWFYLSRNWSISSHKFWYVCFNFHFVQNILKFLLRFLLWPMCYFTSMLVYLKYFWVSQSSFFCWFLFNSIVAWEQALYDLYSFLFQDFSCQKWDCHEDLCINLLYSRLFLWARGLYWNSLMYPANSYWAPSEDQVYMQDFFQHWNLELTSKTQDAQLNLNFR
jgi:hypothetical protein